MHLEPAVAIKLACLVAYSDVHAAICMRERVQLLTPNAAHALLLLLLHVTRNAANQHSEPLVQGLLVGM